MKSEVHDVLNRVELADRVAMRLNRILEQLFELPEAAEERIWLATAENRLRERVASVRADLEQSIALPEFKSVREERQLRLEGAWLTALRTLFGELVQNVGETSPLIEALFPHRRFEKLERGGAVQRAYRTQFATRRGSAYVRRLAQDPEYPFLAPLLDPIDQATRTLESSAVAEELDEEDARDLRAAIARSGEGLARTLRQAKALAEAALIDHPDRLAELGFDERPRKRAPLAPSVERAAD